MDWVLGKVVNQSYYGASASNKKVTDIVLLRMLYTVDVQMKALVVLQDEATTKRLKVTQAKTKLHSFRELL